MQRITSLTIENDDDGFHAVVLCASCIWQGRTAHYALERDAASAGILRWIYHHCARTMNGKDTSDVEGNQ